LIKAREGAAAAGLDPMFGSCSSCDSGLAFEQFYYAGLFFRVLPNTSFGHHRANRMIAQDRDN
jgi:hypothetical protein